MADGPTIETERLRLRAHEPRDFDAVHGMWCDPVVLTHFGGTPATREASWMRILRYAGGWALLGFGAWLVEERATGAFLGEVGFRELQRDTVPSFAGMPEIGWALLPAFHGRGLASEAVAAALAWGDAQIEAEESVAMIAPANLPSQRLAARFGYRPRFECVYNGREQIVFGRPRPR